MQPGSVRYDSLPFSDSYVPEDVMERGPESEEAAIEGEEKGKKNSKRELDEV